jgi:hypothetical protein
MASKKKAKTGRASSSPSGRGRKSAVQPKPTSLPATPPPRSVLTIDITGGISQQLPTSMRKRSTLLLDAEAELLSPTSIRLNLNLVFRHVVLKNQNIFEHEDWLIGSTGAQAMVRVDNSGAVVGHTGETILPTEVTLKEGERRSATAVLKPSVKKGEGEEASEISLGEVKFGKASTRSAEVVYPFEERELAVAKLPDQVEWIYTMPGGPKVTLPLKFGNVPLSATGEWAGKKIGGFISARPLDLQCARRGKPLPFLKSLAAEFRMNKADICGRSGWQAEFREVRR